MRYLSIFSMGGMYNYFAYKYKHYCDDNGARIIILEVYMARKNKEIKKNPTGIRFKDSIKTRLIGVMLFVAAVPLIIAIIISYNTSTSKAKSDALELLEAKGKFVETKFAEIVSENVIALETFAGAPSTITYIQNHGTPDAPIPDEVILAQMDAINTNIDDGNVSVILSMA